jgi:hypothetical protein
VRWAKISELAESNRRHPGNSSITAERHSQLDEVRSLSCDYLKWSVHVPSDEVELRLPSKIGF